MANWTKTPEGHHVALLTPEEDAAASQARRDKNPIEAYFHVQLEYADKPGTWTAHLGESLGDRMWAVLKGGGCWWCDRQEEK